MFVFCIPPDPTLFFITPVYNDPTENEKKQFNGIYTIFETLCFHFENTEFRLSSKHSHVYTAFLRECLWDSRHFKRGIMGSLIPVQYILD